HLERPLRKQKRDDVRRNVSDQSFQFDPLYVLASVHQLPPGRMQWCGKMSLSKKSQSLGFDDWREIPRATMAHDLPQLARDGCRVGYSAQMDEYSASVVLQRHPF